MKNQNKTPLLNNDNFISKTKNVVILHFRHINLWLKFDKIKNYCKTKFENLDRFLLSLCRIIAL